MKMVSPVAMATVIVTQTSYIFRKMGKILQSIPLQKFCIQVNHCVFNQYFSLLLLSLSEGFVDTSFCRCLSMVSAILTANGYQFHVHIKTVDQYCMSASIISFNIVDKLIKTYA